MTGFNHISQASSVFLLPGFGLDNLKNDFHNNNNNNDDDDDADSNANTDDDEIPDYFSSSIMSWDTVRTNMPKSRENRSMHHSYLRPKNHERPVPSMKLMIKRGDKTDTYFDLGVSSFPLLPHTMKNGDAKDMPYSPPPCTYHNILVVLNHPSFTKIVEEIPIPFNITPFPGLSDREIGLHTIGEWMRRTKTAAQEFVDYHKIPDATSDLSASEKAEVQLRECLRTTPPSFFSEDFNIANQPFLDDNELSNENRTDDDEAKFAYQHQLAQWMDRVENTLILQVIARSDSFFTALQNIQSLKEDVGLCLTSINNVKCEMRHFEVGLVSASQHINAKNRRVSNIQKLQRLNESIGMVLSTQDAVRHLLGTGEFATALDMINSTLVILRSDLKGVKCLDSIETKLSETSILIEKLVVQEFCSLAIEGISAFTEADRRRSIACDALSDDDEQRLDALIENAVQMSCINSVIHTYCEQLSSAITVHVSRQFKKLADEVRLLTGTPSLPISASNQVHNFALPLSPVRHNVFNNDSKLHGLTTPIQTNEQPPSHANDAVAELGQPNGLESLSHQQFMDSFRPLLSSLSQPIKRASHIKNKIIAHFPTDSSQRNASVNELTSLLSHEVETIHSKCSRLVAIRNSQHAELPLEDFKEFVDICMQFINDCERICHKTFFGLRGTMLNQAKLFLVHFHDDAMRVLMSSLEKERWSRVEVPREYQLLIDSRYSKRTSTRHSTVLLSGASLRHSSSELLNKSHVNFVPADEIQTRNDDSRDSFVRSNSANGALKILSTSSTEGARVLFVEMQNDQSGHASTFQKFPIVQSVIILLDLIELYIRCANDIPLVTADLVSKLIELLKAFNSRTCGLILGAGAMKLAGFKSITATHLALSSQCVGFVASQLPLLKLILRERLPAKQSGLLSLFDKLLDDIKSHQNEIFKKLIAIMNELLEVTLRKFATDALGAFPLVVGGTSGVLSMKSIGTAVTSSTIHTETVNDSIRQLMKQTESLHRSLSDILSAEQRNTIFQQIGLLFIQSVTSTCSRFDSSREPVRSIISLNVAFITVKLEVLTGIDDRVRRELSAFIFHTSDISKFEETTPSASESIHRTSSMNVLTA